jgi:hypothetical protein
MKGKRVIEEKRFEDTGTWAALNAAIAWAKDKGYNAGSLSHPYPLALVKGLYGDSPLPNKWKDFKKGDMKFVDGMIDGNFRDGPITVKILGEEI